ncbi:hypothetical protein [Candidatus Manganitrophus noduliformans]|uniref:Uncharacterized protein n=1 Tax=Candidatus Manganitrophus noduliformans TaxID=2606439 RepID=A0A7X6ICG2_9BACT|nr:hypothetical protein [Candidatus Manganitrophus noduliformans]NKE72623.1 hypothetical protein [Candidatus Manganitrophus noduliformans]
MKPNPSIEATCSSKLRLLPQAPHVKHCAPKMKMLAKTSALLITVLVAGSVFAADSLILSPTALGPLPLTGRPAKVSETKLKKLFPNLVVKYDIGQGDSPDFHYFEVSKPNGEVLFTIKSFIEESAESKKTTSEVSISILQVRSPEIKDVHGLRVGDRVKDIITKRGKDMEFGAAHHDVVMGAGNIYYSIATGSDLSPERLTMEDAVKGNWKIRVISWPEAAWE